MDSTVVTEAITGSMIPFSVSACKTRAVLTAQQAVAIFEIKLESKARGKEQPPAQSIALLFGVREKAVRDIWNGRTWFRETMHLDPRRTAVAGLLRLPGRPKKSGIKSHEIPG